MSEFCWLLAALLRIHCRFWSDMTILDGNRPCLGPMVMAVGLEARLELGVVLVAKGMLGATAGFGSVSGAATAAVEGAVVLRADAPVAAATEGANELDRVVPSGVRNEGGSVTKCCWVAPGTRAGSGTSDVGEGMEVRAGV